jgi:RimJ/RimL family protein N-acetyltransferase
MCKRLIPAPLVLINLETVTKPVLETAFPTEPLPAAPHAPVIRRLGIADSQPYRAFRLRGLHEYPDSFTSSFEQEDARPVAYTDARLDPAGAEKVWGAFVDGEMVGMIGLTPETRCKSRHKATLFGMFVAPEHAGRGLGHALVNVVLQAARSLGIELIVLTVTDTNKPAISLYEKVGFIRFGTEPDAIRVDGVSFAKIHMYLSFEMPAVQNPGAQDHQI